MSATNQQSLAAPIEAGAAMPDLLISPSVSLINGRPCVSSLAIAEHFGKPHRAVMRDIRSTMAKCPEEFNAHNFVLVKYTDAKGEERDAFNVFQDGFILVVMSYTGARAMQIKLAYIMVFNSMREQLAAPGLPAQPALESADAPITPDQQCTLQAIVKAKIEAIPKTERSNGLYPQVWGRFKNHFRVAKYDQLPQSRMSEAVAYLSTMEVRQKALPEPEKPNLPVPRVPEEEAKSRALKARMEAIHKGAYAVYDELCAEVLLHRRRGGDALGITEVSALSAMLNSIKAAKYAMESVAYAHNWVSYGHLARTGVAMSEWNHECARDTMKRFREEMDLMIGKKPHAGISARL